MKAIETVYKGYKFRSRLEARWAVYLDELKAKWTYEPEGYELPSGRYLPDFFVRMSDSDSISNEYPGSGYWIEIKGQKPSNTDLLLLQELAKHTNHSAYLLCGDPLDCILWSIHREDGPSKYLWSRPVTGPLQHLGNPWFQDVLKAATSARSARFEFGQTTRV